MIFSSIWISWFLSSLTFSYRFEPHTLILRNFSECQDEGKNVAHINQTITRVERNRYLVNGEITFEKPFPNQLEVFCTVSQRNVTYFV